MEFIHRARGATICALLQLHLLWLSAFSTFRTRRPNASESIARSVGAGRTPPEIEQAPAADPWLAKEHRSVAPSPLRDGVMRILKDSRYPIGWWAAFLRPVRDLPRTRNSSHGSHLRRLGLMMTPARRLPFVLLFRKRPED
jgi:hypothetical protein